MSRKTCIIAEIGTSHGGSLDQADELIAAAAEAGADCAKFQAVIAGEILHPRTGTVMLPGGEIPLYERFVELECPESYYRELKQRTEKAGLEFLCTPFGPKSAAILKRLNVERYKIASPELNYDALLRCVAAVGRPVLLSTGVSLLADIEHAVEILQYNFTLIHCITAYPAPEAEYNLRLLPLYAALFGCPTGVSDHTIDPVLIPTLSVAMGAVSVEKHFTLSRSTPGLDDPIALTPSLFAELCRSVRLAEVEDSEQTLARMRQSHGAEIVAAALGTGRKTLAPAEAANYGRTNRSIHVMEALPAGTRLTMENTAVLRTEKRLSPGLPPRFLDQILNCRTSVDLEAGEGIGWEHLLLR